MYRCSECREAFETPLLRYEQLIGPGEPNGILAYDACPYCGSDDIDPLAMCLICGSWYPEIEMAHGLCEWCLGETSKQFTQIVLENFTPEQREFLDEQEDPFCLGYGDEETEEF